MKKDSWLYSDSFLKRAFAIWGHSLVAQLIVMIPIWLIMMILTMTVMRNMDIAP